LLKYNEAKIVNVDNKCQLTPKLISYFDDHKIIVVNVVCGKDFTLALDHIGEVYSFGQNKNQQLGQNIMTYYETTPSIIKFEQPIIKIECGWYHGLALCKLGKVYMWGNPFVEQEYEIKNIPLPLEIEFKEPVIDIVSGFFHMGVITFNSNSNMKSLYTWGGNQYVINHLLTKS